MINICLADNYPVVHYGVKSYFKDHPEISVVSNVGSFYMVTDAFRNKEITAEEHQTVHLLLTKMFSKNFSKYNSLVYAANMMSTSSNGRRLTNKCYGWVKRALSETTKTINEEKIKNGTHLFLNSEFQSWISKKRVYDGTHNLLGGNIQRKSNQQRLENGTHHFLTDNPNNKRIANGTHNFSGGEFVKSRADRAIYKEVKKLYKIHNLKIPKNTFMRSDEYLKNIKQELLSI